MKNKKILLGLLLLLGVGFAAVSTTLYLNGNVNISTNNDDFDVRFTKAILDNNDISSTAIIDGGKKITFETKNLITVGDISVLDFVVTNNSEMYDANVSIDCTASGAKNSYYEITKEVETPIAGKRTGVGKVKVKLVKASIDDIREEFTCSLNATAAEKNIKAEPIPPVSDNVKTLNYIMKNAAVSDAGVDFSQAPVAGVYTVNSTMSDINPIYYYRGAVTNNNVLFANKCWKIVRTTETGGVKLIYNGDPTGGQCLGTNPTIGNSAFNTNYTTPANVRYIYEDGTSSKIKTVIDTWYENNLIGYKSNLEDTPWCMDLNVSSISESIIYYGAAGRLIGDTEIPSLLCTSEYQLKVSTTELGLKLKYPIALLTADEATFAGTGWYQHSGYTLDAYLNIGSWWWTLSPDNFGVSKSAVVFGVNSSGNLGGNYVGNACGVRPSISLAPGTEITDSGDGTAENPYVVQ